MRLQMDGMVDRWGARWWPRGWGCQGVWAASDAAGWLPVAASGCLRCRHRGCALPAGLRRLQGLMVLRAAVCSGKVCC